MTRRLLGAAVVAVLVLGLGVYGGGSLARVLQMRREIGALD